MGNQKKISPNLQLYKLWKGCSLGQKYWREGLLYIVNSKIFVSVKNPL